MGYQNNKLIVTEFKMSRRCLNGDGAGKDNEFHWNVIVNLSYINADTNVIIKNIALAMEMYLHLNYCLI